MTSHDHLKQLTDIKEMMEKSSKVLSLSGLAGVFAGIFAILGALTFYFVSKNIFGLNLLEVFKESFINIPKNLIYFGLLDAIAVGILSIGFGLLFTIRKSRKKGYKIWQPTTKYFLLSLFIPLSTGALFCLFLIKYNLIILIGPCTLIFYGLALVNSSKYTYKEIQFLGITEIALGFIALFFIGFTLIFWIIGFGILHIVYGMVMYKKHE
jgi:hypothetical protein